MGHFHKGLIQKLILTLVLFSLPMAAMGMEESKDDAEQVTSQISQLNVQSEVPMYSDEKPKLFLYEKGDILKWKKIVVLDGYFPEVKIQTYGDSYYDKCCLHIASGDSQDKPIMLRTISKMEDINILSLVEKNETIPVTTSFFSKDKWKFPPMSSSFEYDYVDANFFSWRYVDAIFHAQTHVRDETSAFSTNKKIERLYKTISSEGLSAGLTRWILAYNRKEYCVFFAHNDDEELKNIPKINLSFL